MSYGGISVKFMSNVLIVNRSSLEMPDAAPASNTNVIRIKKKQKQFHKKFLCDTTFNFTKTHL
jgi:hypothetical protein